MSFAVTIKPSYLSDMVSLPRQVAKRLESAVEELRKDPLRASGNLKKLKGYKNLYRYRIGDHRLIYAVAPERKCVQLLAIGIRRVIYDRFVSAPEVPLRSVPVDIEPDSDQQPPLPADDLDASEEDIPLVSDEPAPLAEQEADDLAPEPAKLPAFDEQTLVQWLIPDDHHHALLKCKTDDDLLEASVPEVWKNRVLDCLFPKPIAQVQAQPNLLLNKSEDLTRFIEGDLAGFLLELDPKQEELASRSLKGPAMIKGGPGSGKSTVALYRARALVERDAAAQRTPEVLFTTYTNTLVSFSEQLLSELLSDLPHQLKVATTDSLAVGIVRSCEGQELQIANRRDCRSALAKSRRASLAQHGEGGDLEAFLSQASIEDLPADYLLDEFDWCLEGRGVTDLPGYLSVKRRGRGVRFSESLRRRVWGIYEGYKSELDQKGLITWGDVRNRALKHLRDGSYSRRFDYVLVDEAQDLTPSAIRLCVELCRDPEGLFLAADAGQSIYNRGFSWKEVHEALELRGRTRVLKRNYRTTLQLSKAVADILRDSGLEDTETLVQEAVREGLPPIAKACRDRHSQYQWLAARIREASKGLGVSPWCAAVLCPTRAIAREAADTLRKIGLKSKFMEGKQLRLDANVVKVLTLHSAKGLEFPIVAIPAVEEGLLPLPPSPKGDVKEQLDEQRRLFYVGASRAMRQLFVATGSGSVSQFLESLQPEHWSLRLGQKDKA